jgi:hypothetical protein
VCAGDGIEPAASTVLPPNPLKSIHTGMIAVEAPGATVHEPQVVDEQLKYYAALCAQDARCSARTDDLAEAMRKVSRELPRCWLFRGVGRQRGQADQPGQI